MSLRLFEFEERLVGTSATPTEAGRGGAGGGGGVTARNNSDGGFPRWVEAGRGISLPHLVGKMGEICAARARARTSAEPEPALHSLYVDAGGRVWSEARLVPNSRVGWIEKLLTTAVREVAAGASTALGGQSGTSSSDAATQRWASLRAAIRNGGFPLLYNPADDCTCNDAIHVRWDGRPIPIMTQCAYPSCRHAFPLPTRAALLHAQNSPGAWEYYFRRLRKQYPWEAKRRLAGWRGSFTGSMDLEHNQRYRLCRIGLNHSDTMDVRATFLFPHFFQQDKDKGKMAVEKEEAARCLGDSIAPFEAFAQYRAVFDLDGNKWSSRFANLLCLNSVILKVEPETIDYLYPDLAPWTHFVPVAANLSDATEKVRYVLDGRNDEQMRRIVSNANSWCQRRLVVRYLVQDTLDTLNAYVSELDRGTRSDGDGVYDWSKWWSNNKTLTSSCNFHRRWIGLLPEQVVKSIRLARMGWQHHVDLHKLAS